MRVSFPASLSPASGAALLAACLALPGCAIKVHGVQSSGGTSSTTAVSSHVSGSARFHGGRAAFSSARPAAPRAEGGHVRLSGGAAAVVVVGLMVADLVEYLRGPAAPRPLPANERIMETCSCFQKPVSSE